MNRDRIRHGLLAPMLTTLLVLVSAAAAQAATINVNTTSDAAANANECSGVAGDCSLRQAVDKANSGDTIQLGSGVYSLTQGSDIEIAKSVALAGVGVGSTSIDGSQNTNGGAVGIHRILRVDGATVTIQDLTLTGGDDGADEAPCGNPCLTLNLNGGGAVFDNGSLVLDNVAFENDRAPVGGAVSTGGDSGTLTMTDVSFTGGGGSIGGALFTHGGTVNGNGVTFEDNGNGTFDGGAAYLAGGAVTLTNATIVGNGWAASFGGGIDNAGANLTLSNDTFSGNVRGSIETDNGRTTTVANTIIGAGFSDNADLACVAAGKGNDASSTTSAAITNDLGNNIDEDGSCNLTKSTDFSDVDAHLAPIADNGGPTRTQALLHGSPAIGDVNTTDCPSTDQRGTSRPSTGCDIGAFEAVLLGPPTASTGDAENITDSSADLSATINLHGEAGGFHFLYGTSPGDLSNSTDVAAAGVVSSDTPQTETLSGLTPDTTYYYLAAADNATTSTTASTAQSFKTLPGPPVIQNVSVDSITDTTAAVHFSINPQGSDTTYFVEYGPDPNNYAQQTQPVDVGTAPGFVDKTVDLTGLDPGSTTHFDIVASNDVQQNVDSGDGSFNTLQQIQGTAGQSVTLSDGGDTFACPSQAGTTVDWGDGSSDTGAQIQCSDDGEDGTDFTLSDSHIYATSGDYEITINYSDLGGETDEVADISANNDGLTNTILPTISGTPQQGQKLTTTHGTWEGDAEAYGYQWLDCDANGQNCVNTGTNANTYTLTSSDVGQTIRVIVTASNDGGPSEALSGPTDVVTAAGSPPPSSPPPSSPAPSSPPAAEPTVGAASAQTVTVTSAGFSGSVSPNGLPTQAYFQYGLDPRYSGGGPIVYDHSTPAQSVGSDFSSHSVGPVSISGLLPNALYHVRLVASNSDGATFGPDVTFTTAAAPAPSAPILGKSVNVTPVSGVVLIKINGRFVPLTGADQIPSGSQIDARHGSLELITSNGQKGKTQHGTFGGAIFKLTQERSGPNKGLVTLALLEGAFEGAPSYALCQAHKSTDATIASSKTLQLLKASAHGKFRTKGRYAAATVRGTVWTEADRCDGTLTHVITDSVAVTDLVRHKTIILHAGQSYLAKAHK